MAKKVETVINPAPEVTKVPSVFELSKQRAQQLRMQAESAQASMQEQQNKWQQYMTGDNNPVSELLKVQEPVRNVDAEKRQKEVAKWAVISEGLSSIGKIIAAAGGVRQKPMDNTTLKSSLAELRRLDDIYLAQKARYDQNKILDAIRNQSRSDTLQGQLLSQVHRQATNAESLARAAEDDVFKMQYDQQQQAHREAREDARHKEQMGLRRATIATGRSRGTSDNKGERGEKVAYYINTKDGKGKIAIRPSDELRVLEWAKNNSTNPTDYDMSDGANSPMQHLKIQNLYHKMMDSERGAELDAKYGPVNVVNNGVKLVDMKSVQLREIDKRIKLINDDPNLSYAQKAEQISGLLNNYRDREIAFEYARQNGL